MTDLDAAWAALCIEAKKLIANAKTRGELATACQSSAYLALKEGERGSFYEQAKKEALDKAAIYRAVP